MSIPTNQFLTELDRLGCNFYTGVPCSFIGPRRVVHSARNCA